MMMNGRGGGGGGVGVVVGGGGKGIEDELSLPILLAERVRKAAMEADSFKLDCAEVGSKADLLADMLRSAARRAASTPSPSLYDRPIRRVFEEAAKSLERALALVRRCRRAGILRRVVTITTGSADLRKAGALLDASVGDLRWLLSVYSDDGGGLSLPPIASNDPIISWVWSYIATVHMGASATDRAEAANSLAHLALDNDRNKKIIIEEGGFPPLLSLLRDGPAVESQIAAATALSNLATATENVTLLLKELAVPIIVGVLSDSDSPMSLQTPVASLVSRMAAHDPVAQEEFARENVIRPLVSLLSFQIPLEETKPTVPPKKHTSMHSLIQGMASSTTGSPHSDSAGGSSSWWVSHCKEKEKEKEKESPEVKLQLKIACAEALWMLSRGCVSNSRKIAEPKGLLCLSKIIEREKGDLQYNCLMAVVEIAVAAESDADLRRSAFKTNSPAAKSVVDQLQRLVQFGSNPSLQIAAMKAIGSLARTFPAKEARILSPLVVQLGHWNPDVAAEAANSLAKFASTDNFLRVEHSKAIIEFSGVPPLMRLLRSGEKTQLPALILLCYLALHAPNSEALERSKVLGTLESVARTALAHHPSIKELLPNAIYHLELYCAGANSHGHLFLH